MTSDDLSDLDWFGEQAVVTEVVERPLTPKGLELGSSRSTIGKKPGHRLPLKDQLPELRLQRADPAFGLPDWEVVSHCRSPKHRLRSCIALTIITTAVGATLGLYAWFDGSEQALAAPLKQADQPPATQVALSPVDRSPIVEKIRTTLSAYFEAETIEERCRLVRQSHRTKALMVNHYEKHPFTRDKLAEIDLVASQRLGGFRYYVAQVHTALGKSTSFLLFDYGERCVVDWETHVGYNDITWKQLGTLRPQFHIGIRANARVGSYYNYHYQSPRKYVCVELREPHSDNVLYGYLDRTSEGAKNLLYHLRSRDENPVMVDISYEPTSTTDNQVKIERFVQPSWLRLPTTKHR